MGTGWGGDSGSKSCGGRLGAGLRVLGAARNELVENHVFGCEDPNTASSEARLDAAIERCPLRTRRDYEDVDFDPPRTSSLEHAELSHSSQLIVKALSVLLGHFESALLEGQERSRCVFGGDGHVDIERGLGNRQGLGRHATHERIGDAGGEANQQAKGERELHVGRTGRARKRSGIERLELDHRDSSGVASRVLEVGDHLDHAGDPRLDQGARLFWR